MKWHEKPINVIIVTILFWPLGLYYMWLNKMFFFKKTTEEPEIAAEPEVGEEPAGEEDVLAAQDEVPGDVAPADTKESKSIEELVWGNNLSTIKLRSKIAFIPSVIWIIMGVNAMDMIHPPFFMLQAIFTWPIPLGLAVWGQNAIKNFESRERRRRAEEEREERRRLEEEEREEKRRLEEEEIARLNDQYGEPYGEYVYQGRVENGMSTDAVLASWFSPKFKNNNIWYYPVEDDHTLTLVSFKNEKAVNISKGNKPFELNMSKKDVVSIWGKPEDEKETIFKTKTKLKLYYFPRTTRQDTTVYGYEVKLEDDIVVGWKDLE